MGNWQEFISANQDLWVQRLADAVAIPSVSGDPAHRPDCFKMVDWTEKKMKDLGIETRIVELGKQVLDGKELQLPPVIFGQYGSDPRKKTILVYGHIDVQPAAKSDGWSTEPFTLVKDEKSGRLYGRGSTDDKGPVLGWLNVIEAHQKTNTEFPVNLKMCFECMEESGSEGLDECVIKESKTFLKDIDAVCISDNYWLGTSKPCLTYGLRGLSYFKVTISGPGQDLHSGVFGGTVHEPMTDLFHLFSRLVTPAGEILVPGIKDLVDPLTDEEFKRYEKMDFTIKDIESAVGSQTTLFPDKERVLMGRMRYPSLSLHGIEGAFSGAGAKTVIPAKVHGKFSIRLVPHLTPDKVVPLVKKYLEAEFAKLGSKNTLIVEQLSGGKPWLSDPNHWNFKAGIQATKKVYGQDPDLTREGGSIPVTLTFEEALGKSVMLLPVGRSDDMAHSTNEKLDLSNYIQGSILLGEYLHEVATLAQ